MELSAQELKQQLFISLKSNGVLDSLKGQLRASMLQQLRRNDPSFLDSGKTRRATLDDRILSSIFFDYLGTLGYSFTQSIFVPESQMDSFPPFSRDEILRLLHLDARSLISKQGCLAQQLVATVQRLSFKTDKKDVSAQTCGLVSRDLDSCLKEIDDAYARRVDMERRHPVETLESRMQKLYEDFDNRVNAEVNSKVYKIREFEIDRVRRKEAANYQRQLTKLRQELEDVQNERLRKLFAQENSITDKILRKEKELEVIAYEERQKIIEALESLRAREEKIKMQCDVQDKRLTQWEERLGERERLLEVKEDNVTQMHDLMREQAKDMLSMKRKELEKEYQQLKIQLETERSALEEGKRQLAWDKQVHSAELAEAKNANELLSIMHRRLSSEEAQKEALLQKIDQLEEQMHREYAQFGSIASKVGVSTAEIKRVPPERKSERQPVQMRSGMVWNERNHFQQPLEKSVSDEREDKNKGTEAISSGIRNSSDKDMSSERNCKNLTVMKENLTIGCREHQSQHMENATIEVVNNGTHTGDSSAKLDTDVDGIRTSEARNCLLARDISAVESSHIRNSLRLSEKSAQSSVLAVAETILDKGYSTGAKLTEQIQKSNSRSIQLKSDSADDNGEITLNIEASTHKECLADADSISKGTMYASQPRLAQRFLSENENPTASSKSHSHDEENNLQLMRTSKDLVFFLDSLDQDSVIDCKESRASEAHENIDRSILDKHKLYSPTLEVQELYAASEESCNISRPAEHICKIFLDQNPSYRPEQLENDTTKSEHDSCSTIEDLGSDTSYP